MENNITGNEPAFPGKMWGQQEVTGMTLRQYYAGLAMNGLLYQNLAVDRALNEKGDNALIKHLAAASVKVADELISELNKPQQ